MKDASVFSPGRSNFGLLMSDSEQSSVEVSDHEEVKPVETAVKTEDDSNTEQAPQEDDEWGTVVQHKKQRNPSTPGKPGQHSRRDNYPNKTVFIGNGSKKLPGQAAAPHPPVLVEDIRAETALELHGFPPKYRTGHLRRFVETVAPSGLGFRLKWQNDQSCWVVFDEPEMLKKALAELHDEVIQVRPFDPENLVITAEHQNEGAAPETTASTA
jgi:hypothetical protein